MKLVVGTNNAGKIKELNELLADLSVEIVALGAFENIPDVEETGATFEENAVLKATSYARQTGLTAISDDSGLEVEALGGAPGVYSARYAGEGASDSERIDKLLAAIERTGDRRRRARFVCVMALANAAGEVEFVAEGVCEGTIARAPQGSHGFGYDPVFIPDGYAQTFGELPSAVKQEISHRSRAIKKIIGFLRDFTAQ